MATWPAKTDYATGDVLSATNMNDIGNGLNDLYGESFTNNFYAGKNKIINGDFGIWQRGTSFTNPLAGAYLADRFGCGFDGTGATRTYSQQTFTPGTAPVSGYEAQYYLRLNQSVAGSGGSYNLITQPIEDVRTLAGQTITISFWAKAASAFTFGQVDMYQYFGSGGSAAVTTAGTSSDANVTTSWKRFTYNVNVPSVSGKTIGASSYIQLRIWLPTNTTFTFDIWGVQVEAGSVATPFQTATGTRAGELAACQRYYEKSYDLTTNPASVTGSGATGVVCGTNAANAYFTCFYPFKVSKRSAPTITLYDTAGASGKITKVSAVDLSSTDGQTGTADRISVNSFRIYANLTSCGGFYAHYVAEAEL